MYFIFLPKAAFVVLQWLQCLGHSLTWSAELCAVFVTGGFSAVQSAGSISS
jgi:hypothetical protein